MATIVFVHAHPDDEASQTSGTMARAAAQGHRVVVVYATNGEHGEVPVDLGPGQSVAEYRRGEAEASARVLGTARIAWLGYSDSGMTGWEQNTDPACLHQADLDDAATRLAAILDDERADVVVGYDWHGGYGHPDHIQVHHIVHRAAGLATKPPRLLESTFNRDHNRRMMQAAAQAGMDLDFDPDAPMDDGNPLGEPESVIHWQVDVTDYLAAKRAALQCHSSQVSDIGRFLAIPQEAFAASFGTEHFIQPGRLPGMTLGWPF